MNLKEAYEKMLEGKKVKRKGRSMCCVYDSKENRICTGDGVVVTGIAFEAALADDWEIVEEPIKDWKPKKVIHIIILVTQVLFSIMIVVKIF